MASTEAMCMWTTIIDRSMIAMIMGIAVATLPLATDMCCVGVCRGMLHGSARSEHVGLHGLGGAGPSGEPASEPAAAERRVYADGRWAAGPPRTEAAGDRPAGSALTDVPAPSRIECRLVHVGVEPTGTVYGNTDYWACFD